MPDLDKETTYGMIAIADIRNVQLNEKVSETEYQILHPETNAYQVITNPERRFVTDEEKEKWGAGFDSAKAALHYRGQWKLDTTYKLHDVVYCTNTLKPDANLSSETESVLMFYVYVGEKETISTANNQPWLNLNDPDVLSPSTSQLWMNIDFRSYLASRTQTTRIANSNDYNFGQNTLVTFVKNNGAGYRTIGVDDDFKYNPSTNTFTVTNIKATNVEADKFKGDLEGIADNAIHWPASKNYDGSDFADGAETKYLELDAKFNVIDDTLQAITGGGSGVVLGNALTVIKDGDYSGAQIFNGSTPVTIDIKQSYTPEEITDLLDDGTKKIKIKWLPESVLGQLEYQGTWSPAGPYYEVDTSKQVKGYYFIARANGNYNPDGSASAPFGTNPTYYLTGDWAVYNGTSWDKVDNTDAVTMVNGQIGQVETYKTWSYNVQYHRGDIIKDSGILYICNADHISSLYFISDIANWDLFGRSYTAEDGIKIENNSIIKHDTADPTNASNITNQNIILTKDQTIVVPELTYDKFGHVSKVTLKNITFGEDFIDTVREIKVKGETVLEKTDKTTPLDFRSTTWISPTFEDGQIYFNHKDNGITGAKDLEASKSTEKVEGEDIIYAGQGYSIPSFSIDAAGHVVSGTVKNFKIAESLYRHSHFEIAKGQDGSMVIGAYGEKGPNWVGSPDNALKFYLGSQSPLMNSKMNFNGILNAFAFEQQGHSVLDSRIKLFNGRNPILDRDLIGTYNATDGRLEAPESGIVAGVYSAIAVNSKGIAYAGGHIVEFGKNKNADPSDSLAVGGLFFRWMDTGDTNA